MQRYTKTTSRTVAWLKHTSDGERLVLGPPYQRNPVWTPVQQSALIETILLEYPIPELYMQDIVTNSGSEEHIVVDGQQRVRAVLDFISSQYEISEDITRWAGATFDDLTAEEQKRIFEYDFVVRVLPEMPQEQIRSIFQRINRTNVVLNAQELRHATYWGSFIKTVEELADLEFWEVVGIFTANDRRRMLDAEYVSELAIGYLVGLQNKKAKIEEYYLLYETEFSESRKLKKVFADVVGEIDSAVPNLRKTRWKKKSDFYTLFLCVADFHELLPLSLEGRTKLRSVLLSFGSEVSLAVGKPSLGLTGEHPPALIEKYAASVEKAASDLSSRRSRRDALNTALEPILEAERAARTKLADEPTLSEPTEPTKASKSRRGRSK